MEMKKVLMDSRPLLAMLLLQGLGTALQLLTKVALNKGTFVYAFVVYRHAIATVCVAPFAFFFERYILPPVVQWNKEKKLSFEVWFWLFMNAITGVTMAMGLFYYGLRDTTATFATNMINLVPVITFAFSTVLGIEKLLLKTKAGKIKTAGTVICLAGALIAILYKGESFHIGHEHMFENSIIKKKTHWARGTIMLLSSCLSFAIWYIVQVEVLKVFPLKYWGTMLTFIIAAAQSTVMGLCLNRSKAAWKLEWNMQLATIIFSGAVVTPAIFLLVSWTVKKRGPTFPSMFNPLCLIAVAVLEALIFGEEISLGSLLGMLTIIAGLYFFLWGRRKETAVLPRLYGAGRELARIPESATSQLEPKYPSDRT